MGKSNSSTRRKRLARRQGNSAPAGPLRLHTAACLCPSCEERDKKRTARLKGQTEKRIAQSRPGHSCPELRDEWRISSHRLIEFFSTHEKTRDRKGKLSRVEMRPEWVDYLDSVVGEGEMDASRLWRAFCLLEFVEGRRGTARGRILRACIIDERSQSEVAAAEHMSQQAVSQNLEAATEHLHDIYAMLTLDDHQAAAVS